MKSPLRPTAYSENDANALNLKEPLVLSIVALPSPPFTPLTNTLSSSTSSTSSSSSNSSNTSSASIHEYALRFSIHLSLISLFETLFFWKFVSKTEDAALINLINEYTTGFLNACAGLTDSQRALLRDMIDRAINPTNVSAAAAAATAQRDSINNALMQNSWFYFGGILSVVVGLSAWGKLRGYKMNWRSIVGENIALVTLLGLYEWMYFSTVILQYQAISMPELDRMVMDNFQASC